MPVISLPEMVPEWSSTGVDGNRVVTGSDGGHVTVSGVHCSLATCPQSGQVSIYYRDVLTKDFVYVGKLVKWFHSYPPFPTAEFIYILHCRENLFPCLLGP